MSVGYIYVLLNEAYRGLVKIGKTTKHPDQRAIELSGTGVPHPFLVAYYEKVSDCDLAERLAHDELKKYRKNAKREFFEVSSTEAIKTIQQIAEKVNREFPTRKQVVSSGAQSSSPPPLPRLYAVSFNCDKCDNYSSATVERYATTATCPTCHHENPIDLKWL